MKFFNSFQVLFFLSFIVIATGCATTSNPSVTNGKKAALLIQPKKEAPYLKGVESEIYQDEKNRGVCREFLKGFENLDWKAQLSHANVCAEQKDWATVEEMAKGMSQSFASSPWGPYFLSLVAENRGDFTQGLWMMELALKKSPQPLGLFFYQKARLLFLEDKKGEAFDTMKKALELDPKLTSAHYYLGTLYYLEGDYKQAAEQFQSFAQTRMTKTYSFYSLYSASLMETQKWADAAQIFEQTREKFPEVLSSYLYLADLYEGPLKDPEHALTTLKQVENLSKKGKLKGSLPTDFKSRLQKVETALAEATKKGVKK